MTVKANLLGALGKATNATIPIKKLVLKDIGSGDEGVLLSKLTVLLVEALLQATAKAGIKDLPDALLNNLGSQLGASSGVSLTGFSIDTGKGLTSITGGIVDKINEATSKGTDAVGKSIGDALDNAFGNKKKE